MSFFSSIKGYLTFKKKIKFESRKTIVVYSESKNYRNYFVNLIESLGNEENVALIYLTSDKKDLELFENNIKPIFIGSGIIRIFLFTVLKCNMLIMTLTDLGNHEIKKSKNCKNYLYIFHSLVSTKKTYTHSAFQHYDIIFTNGEYQKKELELNEKTYNFSKKKIFNIGFSYLEKLEQEKKDNIEKEKILFAPSWTKSNKNIFNDHSKKIIDILLEKKLKLILRTHPELIKRGNKTIKDLKKNYKNNKNFEMNLDISNLETLNQSYILITDNGGMAIEYLIVQKKPVIFLNYAEKIHNTFYKSIPNDTVEEKFKKEFGFELEIKDLDKIDLKIKEAIGLFESKKDKIEKFATDNNIILKNQTNAARNKILELV